MIEIDELFKRTEKAEAEFKVLKEEADREVDERERQEAQATREAEEAGEAAPLKLEKGALVRINVVLLSTTPPQSRTLTTMKKR